MDETIYELIQKVRQHPDYVFGTIFTTGDFASAELARECRDSHWNKSFEEHLTEIGNELIASEFGPDEKED